MSPRLYGMSCGHLYCLNCWQGFFDVRISSSHNPVMECMEAKCQVRIADDFIMAILGDLRSALKYKKHIINEMIEVG